MESGEFLTPARIESYRRRQIPNEYRVDGDVAYILLLNKTGTLRCETKVDADLLPRLLDYARWRPWVSKEGGVYAVGNRRCLSVETGGRLLVYLHRVVLEMSGEDMAGWYSDHINGDTLDNRRAQLRRATSSINVRNNYRDRRIAQLEAEVARLQADRA